MATVSAHNASVSRRTAWARKYGYSLPGMNLMVSIHEAGEAGLPVLQLDPKWTKGYIYSKWRRVAEILRHIETYMAPLPGGSYPVVWVKLTDQGHRAAKLFKAL